MPLPVSNDPVTDQGRLYVSPSLPVGDGELPIAPVADPDAAAMTNVPTDGNANVPNVATRVINKLLGTGGEERYKTWPEKLLRDALSAPHDVLNSPVPSTSGDLIKPALDMSALAGTGGLGGVGEGAIRTSPEVAKDAIRYYHGGENPTSGGGRWLTPSQEYAKNYGIGNKEVHYVDLPIDKAIELGGYDEINSFPRNFNAPENIAKNLKSVTSFLNSDVTLGSSPFLRPALKYEGKIYKAPQGAGHMDAIPETLRPEFTRQAMSGEDISNFNFGFMNHKGQFLDREKALKYAIDEGLLSPHSAQYGALTSTLMADSSKPGAAIKAMEYPLAKPSDRWSNTLGQNDNLIQNMTPDQFLNKSRKLKIDAESRETIDDLKQHIEEGKPLDPLELHSNGKEDGRHRAIAAKELGIKEVPVINFRADSSKEAAVIDILKSHLSDEVPLKPGTAEIPSGSIRLYHQTSADAMKDIAENGIDINKAKGIEGPRAIYADEKGFYGKPGDVPTVEFHVPKERWNNPFVRADSKLDNGKVSPENIIGIHLPWHSKANYIMEHPKVKENVLSGQHDDLLSEKDYGKAIAYIKSKYKE